MFIKRIAFLTGCGPDPLGKPGDKSAEEDLAEALRLQASLKQADLKQASAQAVPQR